MYLTIITEG